MVRQVKKLSARFVASVAGPGQYSDGGNLYLIVDASGAKRWTFIFRWQGRRREMGLGGTDTISLAEARELAAQARKQVSAGVDPIRTRRAARTSQGAVTFGDFADQVFADLLPSFRSEKSRRSWEWTMAEYAKPIRGKPIDAIETADILSLLKPIWLAKAETASRVRGRIERILDAAKATGLRSGDNPARWRGHLDHLLPKRQRLQRGHHAAMPFAEVPAFMERLRGLDSASVRALEFTILTACRSGEVRLATWDEFDLDGEVWTIPGGRMKAGREHRAPITPRMAEILTSQRGAAPFVFEGARSGRPLSNMSFTMVLRRMGHPYTVHGFRSSFRDWAGETTSFAREVAEAALAHTVGDETERAYRRGDALAKRRRLMLAWERYCLGEERGKVVSITR
ncbi:tyrosine-type recombinase/integrase [Rhodobium gokarnense]|uniref:Integrase n=1 Tax=Rhodobium gokarnense TaxID=364296 RepID=A0ABT3HHX0_9HYPH|nr:site-specific integrase [Rhodobium gokarnense]MCW2309904.1 integrase [Rhodobium gokarnense]